jgi:preprotein translocase subunit YajC
MLISTALAQESGGGGGGGGLGGPDMLTSLLPLVLIFVVFYFLMIRPQQKKMKAMREMIGAVKRGDRVVTSGGIIGEVVHIREVTTGEGATPRPMEDEITIKSGDSTRLVVERGKIARVGGGPGASTKE